MGLFEKIFGRASLTRATRMARRAELRGDLAQAVIHWGEAGRPDEAARVLILRGDAETDAQRRLLAYTQAAGLAPEAHPTGKLARTKRAQLVLAMAGDDGVLTGTVRADLIAAARELEELGEPHDAARAYARAGDDEGQARALAQAGEIDRLELLLTDQHIQDTRERRARDAHAELELLASSGKRREALAAAEVFARDFEGLPAGQTFDDRARTLRARRVAGPVVRIILHGRAMPLALGASVVIGRTEGTILVASSAVSRRHLAVERDGDDVVVRDLGSHNGTLLRGLALAGAARLCDGIDLKLGREVTTRIAPAAELAGAVAIEVAGTRYVAPLGPARLGVGAWRLEQAADGWIELVTDDDPPALLVTGSRDDRMRMGARVTLLTGDAVASSREGDVALRIGG